MFKENKAFSGFSVNDLGKAKQFYGEVLGLQIEAKPEWLELRISGSNPVLVYPKPDHQPATFTILNFPVKDIGQTVAGLKKLGIRFESYQQPEFRTDENGITAGNPRVAWFKDPAGNILSVVEDKR